MSGQLAAFSLEVGPLGYGHVEVNGNDITQYVSGLEFQGRPGQPSVLTVHTMAPSGTIKGEGIVQVRSPANYDPEAIVEFLSAIDPAFLEATVLETTGFGESPMAMALQVLQDWAHGHKP